ncbi:Eukaryotic translation initiation factor 2-alpha kinase [Entomortierella beljakovae]|nr:Eukaryotic translation initiation factor 2-alpha kinase [Entomortierella beljakovae]
MLKTPTMAEKDTDESSMDRPASLSPSSWSRGSPNIASSRNKVDPRIASMDSIRYGRDQGLETNHGSQPSLTVLSEMRGGRLVRNTTVMTLHSDSEPEYENTSTNPINNSGRGLMRTTTVMTLHSDSDTDADSNSDGNEDSNISFDISESGSLKSSAQKVNRDPYDQHSPIVHTRAHRFTWSVREEMNDGHMASTYDEYGQESHVNVMVQGGEETSEGAESEVEEESQTEEDEDEEDEDEEDEEEEGQSSTHQIRNSRFESYLLAPMGFVDDDDDYAGSPSEVEGYSEAAERFQMFAGVNEFDESDQIGFEDHTYQVIPKNKRRSHERMMENKRRQGKLLLVSLLDNFCVLYDQSPERNRKLFYVICKTLSNMGIIDEEYLEEMSAVRSSYQRAFRSLVLSALTSIKQEQMIQESRRIMAPPSTPIGSHRQRENKNDMSSRNSTQSITESFSSKGIVPTAYINVQAVRDSPFSHSTSMMRTMSFGDMFDNDPTRYKHDVVEICKLGKGGFASVFKARNKLDAIEYAIKKIRLRGSAKVRYEKIFREIKFLARLDHKNVIRYYSSWLEHADYPVSRKETYYGRACGGDDGGGFDSNGEMDDDFDDEYGDEDEFTNTTSMRGELTVPPQLQRRLSIDYFSPHKEQHSVIPDDLSMGIVFGDDNDCEDDGIDFEDADTEDQVYADMSSKNICTEEMERNHSASSTLTCRNIPVAPKPMSQRRKYKSPTLSQELCDVAPSWDESETSTSKARSNKSNSFSTMSSSIEEIQRSLPSSDTLGSRYGEPDPNHQMLDEFDPDLELRPFSFPNHRSKARDGFLGGEHGGTRGGARRSSVHGHRNSNGQIVTRELTLFIQMQLCQTTLQDYLVYRNERPVPVPRASHMEPNRKPSLVNRFGISSSPNLVESKTQSTPGSPLQQNIHRDLVDPAVNQHIFRAIVEGVAYIHDQDMIHRDLKPGNIFLGLPPGYDYQKTRSDSISGESVSSKSSSLHHAGFLTAESDQSHHGTSIDTAQSNLTKEQIQEELFLNIEMMVPKIGDFGLVTDIEGGAGLDGDQNLSTPGTNGPSAAPLMRRHSSTVTTGSHSSRTRTTAVGTVTYASPEQLARPNLGYDQKADIYSLGIIFFELYHPFSTLMERHAVLRTLRNGELPPDFVSQWPKEAAVVLWLMAEDPRLRPSAREILEFDLIRKQKDEPVVISTTVNLSAPSRVDHSTTTNTNTNTTTQTSNPSVKIIPETIHGLGLSSTMSVNPTISSTGASTVEPHATRVICEDCQARCRCHESLVAAAATTAAAAAAAAAAVDSCSNCKMMSPDVTSNNEKGKSSQKGHRSSKSLSSRSSRIELEQRIKDEQDRVQRLEMSMKTMRAENKALLDRIQELEYEKEMSMSNNRRCTD